MNDIANIRKEYKLKQLSRNDLADSPFVQFENWWKEAMHSDIDEVNAMALSTVNGMGRPSVRIVLLKGFDESGFTFFTNYESHKALDMEDNPQVALLFFWKELQRQVRIEGRVHKIDESESDTYFAGRPTGSKLGAWASPQSRVIASRNELEATLQQVTERFKNTEIVRPQHWGGYQVTPSLIEFWQGRESRLHDRFQYARQQGKSGWSIERLAP